MLLIEDLSFFVVGAYMSDPGHSKRKSTASSPVFTYSSGTNINIEYVLRQSSSDSISIFLYNVTSHLYTLLWESPQYAMFGVFKSCIRLPDAFAMTEVQLTVEFMYGDIEWYDEINRYTALRSLTFTQNACQGKVGRYSAIVQSVR